MMRISPTRPNILGKLGGVLAVALVLLAAPVARAQTASAPERLPTAAAPTAGYVAGTEEISAFNADLVVTADGWLDVTETISYFMPQPKHGIIRAVPYEYDVDGERWRTPLEVLAVTDKDRQPLTYSQSQNGALWEIKIGDADKLVSGLQTYVIHYRVAGVLKRFADHDELYWNVTGHDWLVPIKRVAATLTLPADTSVAGPEPLCYVGPAGSTSQEGCMKSVGTNWLSFAASAPITVVVGFTPGVIAQTGMVKPPFPWLDLLPALLPLATLIGMLYLWRRYGRDPAGRGTIVVQYDPPEQLPPAMMGVVFAETPHGHDHAATIVDLAVRGYLTITETQEEGALFGTGRDITLTKAKDYAGDATVRDYERLLLDALFKGGSSVTMAGLKKSQSLGLARTAIEASLVKDCVTAGYFPESPMQARAQYLGVASMLFIAFFILMKTQVSLPWGVAAGVSAGLIAWIGWYMPRRTVKGVLVREQALGYKDYLQTAEKYRLQWQEKGNVFERYLPYAMAFGVVDKWTKAFADQPVSQPSWYVGRPGTVFNAMMINDSLGRFDKTFSHALNSVPQSRSGRSSGFSGGFSGGGFGGGGGRSW